MSPSETKPSKQENFPVLALLFTRLDTGGCIQEMWQRGTEMASCYQAPHLSRELKLEVEGDFNFINALHDMNTPAVTYRDEKAVNTE